MKWLSRWFPMTRQFFRQLGWLWFGPVFRRESRSRLRGVRTVVVQTAFMVALALAFYFSYRIIMREGRNVFQFSDFGRRVFLSLSAIECGLIMLLTPAFTCATITSERENGTLDLLRTSLLDPGAVLVGKLVASLYYVLMLLFSSVPIFASCLLLGGLSPLQIGLCLLVLLGTILFYGWLGLFFSVVVRRTATAAALSYCAALALNLLPLGVVHLWDRLTDVELTRYYYLTCCSSPIANLRHILDPNYNLNALQNLWFIPGAVLTWGFYGALAVLLGVVMWRRLSRELGSEPRGVGPGRFVPADVK